MTSESTLDLATGTSGYRGSPAEMEDRASGIKVGGRCLWLADGYPAANITSIRIDKDGDPWFTLSFDDHKDVVVERNEIAPTSMLVALTTGRCG